MDYYCYISKTKVDALYERIEPEQVDEWLEKRIVEHDVGLGANVDVKLANLWSLIKGEITYGRKGVIHREQTMRVKYAEKLRRVMVQLSKDKAVHNVMHALESGEFPGLYYHATGSFSLAKALETPARSTEVVTLHCALQHAQLSLDCSLEFFSEGNQPEGDFQVNSLNARFFQESQPLALDTTFLLLSKTTEEIVGSPLYLKLEAGDHSSIL